MAAPKRIGHARYWKPWSNTGIFAALRMGLSADHGEQKIVMTNAAYPIPIEFVRRLFE